MKKSFLIIILTTLLCALFVSCSDEVGNNSSVHEKAKAFQIVETNESSDTLEGVIRYLKNSSGSKGVERRTIRLNQSVVDPGVVIADLDYEIIIDLQNNTYTLKNGGTGIVINNDKSVEITGESEV